MKNVIKILKERGFIEALTSDELYEYVETPQTIYIGFDPTSDSLHVGNLICIIALAWFQKFGHQTIALVGGATGMIGDPSGKSVERNLLDPKTLETNLAGIERSLKSVLKSQATVLNNYTWFQKYGYIDFLRDIGKHFRLGSMLAKDSVKTRLASDEGLSYTEFSYQLLQAYDFLYLHDHHKVTIQMGGSDQWGNITAGTELVRKMRGKTVHGLTFPLLTRSDGKKFGKSEEGAIWLNADKLPPYDFYQYFYRLPDADVPKMFRMLTFLDLEEIKKIEDEMKKESYAPNSAQKRLAEEVTRIVHGEEGLESAKKITLAAAPGAKTVLDRQTLEALESEIPSKSFAKGEIIGLKMIDLYVLTELIGSKGEARRLILNGGVYFNNEKISDELYPVSEKDLVDGDFLLLGVGKKKKMIVRVI